MPKEQSNNPIIIRTKIVEKKPTDALSKYQSHASLTPGITGPHRAEVVINIEQNRITTQAIRDLIHAINKHENLTIFVPYLTTELTWLQSLSELRVKELVFENTRLHEEEHVRQLAQYLSLRKSNLDIPLMINLGEKVSGTATKEVRDHINAMVEDFNKLYGKSNIYAENLAFIASLTSKDPEVVRYSQLDLVLRVITALLDEELINEQLSEARADNFHNVDGHLAGAVAALLGIENVFDFLKETEQEELLNKIFQSLASNNAMYTRDISSLQSHIDAGLGIQDENVRDYFEELTGSNPFIPLSAEARQASWQKKLSQFAIEEMIKQGWHREELSKRKWQTETSGSFDQLTTQREQDTLKISGQNNDISVQIILFLANLDSSPELMETMVTIDTGTNKTEAKLSQLATLKNQDEVDYWLSQLMTGFQLMSPVNN